MAETSRYTTPPPARATTAAQAFATHTTATTTSTAALDDDESLYSMYTSLTRSVQRFLIAPFFVGLSLSFGMSLGKTKNF